METSESEPHSYSVLCWGSSHDGQFGLGGIEESFITLPRELPYFIGREVKMVACGESHTMFTTKDGALYSTGNNDYGQLGHEKSRKKPERVSVLESQVVAMVACSSQHTLAVTDTGQTFTWGSNLQGQLGRGYTDNTFFQTPKLVKHLSAFVVKSVACGNNHSLVLTNDGQLFTWGGNTCGQLGQGSFSEKIDIPVAVSSLRGVPLAQIEAGGEHSLALSKSGALFSWGKNNFGQLGIGDDKNRFYPTLVKTLRSQRIKYTAGGEDHTVVLTQEGGVFTFGAGSYGQLGHNSANNELLPRKVFELMGIKVTQISCGKRHTMAYVPSTGRVYTFGLGGSGQLGIGQTLNRQSPTTVQGPFIPFELSSSCPRRLPVSDKLPPYVIKHIYAGGNQSFVLVTALETGQPPDDFRIPDPQTHILTVTPQKLDELVSVAPQQKPSQELADEIEKMFSSITCLNGSFLISDDEHFRCSGRNHGVDIDLAMESFSRLRALPNNYLTQVITRTIEKQLIPTLPERPPDVEAMRVYITLPYCHLFERPDCYSTVMCPFAKAVTSLGTTPSKIIDMWWSRLPKEHFGRLVNLYKQTVLHILCLATPLHDQEVLSRQNCLRLCMDFLKKLNQVNGSSCQIVAYDSFYISDLKNRVDIQADYINWIQHGRSQLPRGAWNLLKISLGQESAERPVLSFCDYPFVFNAQAKTMLLQTDALLQMRVAVDEVNRRNLTAMIIPAIDPVNPCLVLYVSRTNIVQDTLAQLCKQGSCDFKKPLKVIFLGEDAVDQGGVTKEFFLLMIREVLDPKYGMFNYFEESRLLWFNEKTFEDPAMFSLIGVLCGLAIYNSTIIDLKFPLALFKKLLRQPPTHEDLHELRPDIARSLQSMLDYEGDDFEETFSLTFDVTVELYGEIKQVDLIPNGSQVNVTKFNRQEYVDAYINYVFNTSTEEQFKAFYEGFHRVCGGRVLDLFHPLELQAMVVGNENYDWEELEKNCEYKNGYQRNHETIKFFWEVFRSMSLEDKKKFLLFLTGSDRIPIHGMKSIKMYIQPTGGGEDYLPVAHTCFNLMDLPRYHSKENLRRKLLQAIQQTEGFGIV